MSKKKSSKPNQTFSRAQHRNMYLLRLKNLFKLLGNENLFKLLPESERDLLYRTRMALRIRFDDDIKFSDSEKKQMSQFILLTCSNSEIVLIPEKNIKTSLTDLVELAYIFQFYLEMLDIKKYPGALQIKKAFEEFQKTMLLDGFFADQIFESLSCVGFLLNGVNYKLYYPDYEFVLPGIKNPTIEFIIHIKSVTPEKKYVKISGIAREVSRVGWVRPGYNPDWVSVTFEKLGIQSSFKNLPVDVYIQKHALHRMVERLVTLPVAFILNQLNCSLLDCRYIIQAENEYLIEYQFLGKKIGYLPACYTGGILVVKSFLLLTNDGTPEAEKLQKITGFTLEDRKYLNLDRLAAFTASDIKENLHLKQLFTEAGCESLFEMEKYKQELFQKTILHKSEQIESFINKKVQYEKLVS